MWLFNLTSILCILFMFTDQDRVSTVHLTKTTYTERKQTMANELDVVSGNSALSTGKPSFSLSSLNLSAKCPSIVVAPTGSKLSRYPFPKIKFEEGRRCRVSLLTEDVIMIKLHYHPDLGYVLCDGGACCKYCDRVSIKYCYPCVMYETNNSGQIVSQKVELRLLVLGGEMYDQISLLSEIGGSITNMDLLFSCTSTQYQKCQVTQAGGAYWLNNPDMVQYVTNYMNSNGDKILDAMGRTYTNEEFIAKLGDPNAPVADQKCISADALSDIYKV